MDRIQIIDNFLSETSVFYLTTVDCDKPRCRPIGFHLLKDDKLYFGVGTFKDVYAQMQVNPNVEICASKGGKFLRYYGKAVFETNDIIANDILSRSPSLSKIYNDSTGHKLGIFHLENAIGEIHVMSKLVETYVF